MTELETQVVKIQLGDNRQSSTFVYTLAETIDSIGTEIYVICELPMFNPAAKDECQRISEAITASLKRTYRRVAGSEGASTAGIFESGLASINEELSKLVTLGKTHWLGKLNAAVAVKFEGLLSVSSVGKMSALIYRDGKFSSITDSTIGSNQPLKTFEQFSEGKMRLGDLFMLSTPELLNHISIDRIKNLIDKNDLPIAAQSIIEYLNDDMGPDVSCGTIFALQVEAGTTSDEEVDLGQYLTGPIAKSEVVTEKGVFPKKVRQAASTGLLISKNFLKDFKTKYIKKTYWQGVISKSSKSVGVVSGTLKKTASKLQPNQITGQISGYSRQKKFFLISTAILLISLVATLAIARMNKQKTTTVSENSTVLSSIEKSLNDANASLVYGDEAQAVKLYAEVTELFKKLPSDIDKSDQASKYNDLKKQASEIDLKLNKVDKVNATSLGTLGNGSNLINLPDFLAVEVNRSIVAYQKSSKSIVDNKLKSSEPILDSASLASNMAAIYNGSELFVWDYTHDIVTGRFSDNVPTGNNYGGMKVYATNNKVYVLDKAKGEVKNFSTANRTFTSGSVSATDEQFKSGSDLAIDGSIYVATSGTILKYNSGKKQDFNIGIAGLSNTTKLFTQNDFANLYVLDSGNKRLIILNKNGALIKTMTSDQFTELKDFTVDEKGKAIYILNGSELLQVKF